MSKKIKELAAQAKLNGVEFDGVRYYVGNEETFLRFAELIVRECANIADADEERPYYIGCGYITKTTGEKIQEHFGLK